MKRGGAPIPPSLLAAHYRSGARMRFHFLASGAVERRPEPRGAPTELVFGPGFCDLQCNGFAGVDFNSPQLTTEGAREGLRQLWRHGCTSVLPTVITHQPERMEFLLETLSTARDDPLLTALAAGFHVEGPFISPVEGARGAHPLHAVRAISGAVWRRLQRASGGRIRLLTLAPELRGAARFIRELRGENVLPALGHTMAAAAQIAEAAAAGALLSTHLGNGCPATLARHGNPVFAQLGCDALAASFIADGVHLPPEVLRSLARAKGLLRTILVSDAMAAAGATPGRYTLGDLTLLVGRDGVVREPGRQHFAGSALTMEHAVANLAGWARLSLAEAWDCASLRPRALLRQACGNLAGLRDPGLTIARIRGGRLEICATVRRARVLWLAPLSEE